MITEQERIIRESQGYDLGFEFNGRKYWLNTNDWNEEKEERLYKETGLRSFREEDGNRNLVIYEPKYFEVWKTSANPNHLHYKSDKESNIPQPINMSSAYNMFRHCRNLTSLDLSNWDVSSVKDMFTMFYNCKNLTTLNISNWDVSKVEDMFSMFLHCENLTSLDLSNWDVSKVKNMNSMFYNCTNLTSLDLGNWDVSKVKNMGFMFSDCENLTSLDLSNWDAPNVEYMNSMFSHCENLYSKYSAKDDEKLLHKIIEDSNSNNNLEQMNLF